MTASDLPPVSSQRQSWPFVSIAGGALLIGLSMFWPAALGGRSGWTDAKAIEYQKASADFHELAHELGHRDDRGGSSADTEQKVKAAEARFDQLRGELQAARGRTLNWAIALRVIGAAMAITGAVAYFATRRKHSPDLREFHKVSR